MATKSIAWQTGTGNITLSYTGQGDDNVLVSSDANNLYESRSQTLTFTSLDNTLTQSVTVTQPMREPNFKTSQGQWFVTYDDKYLIVQE